MRTSLKKPCCLLCLFFMPWTTADTASAAATNPPLVFIVLIDVSGSMRYPFPAPVQPVLSDTSKLDDVKRRLTLLADHLPAGTRILVKTFDHQLIDVVDLQVTDAAARERLKRAFAAIKSREGSTYLWRSADHVLKLAQQLAEAESQDLPGRVRVLLLTDGEDTEKAPKLNHATLVAKYRHVLESVVTVDWITLGYDVKADVKATLEGAGVRFTKALTAEEVLPLRAGFRLSAMSVQVGEPVKLVDQSIGILAERNIDWGDGTGSKPGDRPIHRYTRPGRYVVRYQVKQPGKSSAKPRTSEARATLIVTAPTPPVAKFRFSTTAPRLGETVALINESSASAVRFEWRWGAGSVSSDRHPTFALSQFGDYLVTLTVWDQSGQSSRVTQKLSVVRPEKPVVAFEFTASVGPDDEITLVDTSSGLVDGEGEWYLDGKLLGSGRTWKLTAPLPGQHAVRRVITGPGGTAELERPLIVAAWQPPQAGFTVGNPAPFVGDVIVITDISKGSVSEVAFAVAGDAEPMHLTLAPTAAKRWFELPCQRVGKVTIRQTVRGPGGQDEYETTLEVAARSVQPRAIFEVDRTPGRGLTNVGFRSRCTGTIAKLIFDPGDGSPAQEFSGARDFSYRYRPGQWTPRIEVHGPAGENLVPAAWQGPTLDIAPPTPDWVYRLAWQLPLGALVLTTVGIGAWKRRARTFDRRRALLCGNLVVSRGPRHRDVQCFEFPGTSAEEEVEVEPGTRIKLTAIAEQALVNYRLELSQQDRPVLQTELEEGLEVLLEPYRVTYTA
ncbi:MAG: PKD domain-containing protein [Pirellulales bacterium]|nr:PKD domain-containing protein [Pirellulales bacterium]